jgi:hypothetical protein
LAWIGALESSGRSQTGRVQAALRSSDHDRKPDDRRAHGARRRCCLRETYVILKLAAQLIMSTGFSVFAGTGLSNEQRDVEQAT